jgi:hypothetical protein
VSSVTAKKPNRPVHWTSRPGRLPADLARVNGITPVWIRPPVLSSLGFQPLVRSQPNRQTFRPAESSPPRAQDSPCMGSQAGLELRISPEMSVDNKIGPG